MAKSKLTVYCDVVSPFAYMAFYITQNSALFKQADITVVPTFLGGVMTACANTPPINIKHKGEYIGKERIRLAKRFNVPMASGNPDPFPQLTLSTMRALVAVQQLYGEAEMTACMAACYEAFWVRLEAVSKPEVFVPVIQAVLGEERTKRVVERMATPECKKQLIANVDAALAEGAFGAPWFVAESRQGIKECFWGVDSLGAVAEHLGLERKGAEEGFRSML